MSHEVKYRPDVDGLRAIAVGAVVLFHAGVAPIRGGFVGVDVFFVISGYLITTIIAREALEGRFTVAGFYVRRVRRIFPALFYMLWAVGLVATLVLMPADYNEFGESVSATALFTSNLFFWIKSGYFDAAADIKPLLHTWSLAVEEQFYLLFPLLMAAIVTRLRWWRLLIAAIALVSFAVGVWEVAHHPAGAFYSPFARAWELLLGSLIAVGAVPPIRSKPLREAAAALGLGLILFAVFAYTPATPFPGVAALSPCLGAALLIHADAEHPTIAGRIISVKPMVWLGLISYSLYLWHWPVLVFARYILMRPLQPAEMAALVAASVLLAYLSWRFVERPFRRGNARRAALFGVAGAMMLVATLFGAWAHLGHGLPQRLPGPALRLAAAADDINPYRAACDRTSVERLRKGDACILGDPKAAAPTFALMGDSFGDALMPAVVEAAKEHGRKGLMLTYSGCLSLIGVNQDTPGCRAFLDAAVDLIRRTPSIDRVIIVDRWTTSVIGTRFGAWPQTEIFITDARSPERSYAENPRAVTRGLAATTQALAPRKVFLVGYLPEQAVDIPRAEALASWYRFPPEPGVAREAYDRRQAPVHAVLEPPKAAKTYDVLDAAPFLCDARRCPAMRDGVVLYSDDNHVSASGARSIRALLAPALAGP